MVLLIGWGLRTMTATNSVIQRLLQAINKYRPIRASSLILTVFGDTVSQHGGSIWLGSLIEALEPLGLNEKLVRTSVLRLVRSNWLCGHRIGRCSYYNLSPSGYREFARAAQRIYAASQRPWNGQWTLLMIVDTLPPRERNKLRERLLWQGFGPLLPNMYAHPSPEHKVIDEIVLEMDLTNRLVIWEAAHCPLPWSEALSALVKKKWNMPYLEQDYMNFLHCFRGIRCMLPQKPQYCFQLRTLLIHEYRRILLRDPDLPLALMTPDWPGFAAQNLTRNLYLALSAATTTYIRESLLSAEGHLPMAAPAYAQRFCNMPEPLRELL